MVGLTNLANESRSEVGDAPRSASDSKQISGAQQEVQDTLSNGNAGAGSYDQIKQNSADLEKQGTLPSFSLDDKHSSAQSSSGQSDKKSQSTTAVDQSNSQVGAAVDHSNSQTGAAADQSDVHPTGISKGRQSSADSEYSNRCAGAEQTVADGRLLPTLSIESAGLPVSDSMSTESAFPVNNNDGANDRTFVTAAHGLTKVSIDKNSKYQLLDEGFAETDSNRDGNLSKEELQTRLSASEQSGKSDDKSASLRYQAQYVLDNYDSIANKSKELDPHATGVSNEGLAQYYMEHAKITVNTPDGQSFPAHLESGDRNKDVAVLKATDLSAEQKSAVGKNFEMADTDAKPGDYVNALGYPGGDTRASKMCYVPNQISGMVTGEKRSGDLISGNVQDTRMVTLEGMSGGPVLDPDHGNKVVGINHASVNKTTHSEMVPASAVKEQLEKARLGKR